MKLIVSLFNQLQKLVFDLSRVIMKGYIFIINKTSSGVSETGINDVWMMLRDICNMFFILVLLIIGISTILGIKKYSYKKNLVNVLISAFLINYSKVIVGMLIDFSQIFIIPFNDAISGNISLITDAAFFIDVGEKNISAAILGFIFALGFFAVSIIALVYALVRLVFIWITIAISPIIVLGYGVPFDKVKTSLKGFFKKFVSFLTGGILLSFFMWFALYILSASSSSISNSINNETSLDTSTIISAEEGVNDIKGSNLILMIVSLAFLIYAQKFAISSSKQAGSFAGDIVSKASSIGMKPLNGLKGLGIKSSNLGKKALGGVGNWGKDYTSSALDNIRGVGLSSLKNRSSRFDNFMTKRDERISMGNKEFRAQQVNKKMFGGKDPKASLKNQTVESLGNKKLSALAELKSNGASVSEIKIAGFNWDLKTKELEISDARKKLKNASTTDEKDKAQRELNSKRAEQAKIGSKKNKYINELKNIQFGKSSISEDSAQLKNINERMDSIGTGDNIKLKVEYASLLDSNGEIKKETSSDNKNEIMAIMIAKAKSKNLANDDIEFIKKNFALFRSMNQDIIATFNDAIDEKYADDQNVQKLKQPLNNRGNRGF